MAHRSRTLTLVLAALASALVSADDAENKAKQRVVPHIVFIGPDAQSLYAPFCNLSLIGFISRPLGWKQNVDFRFYQVLENGQLYSQGGGSVQTDETGQFSVTFNAPHTAWKAGTLRVYARVNGFSAITGIAEAQISNRPVDPIDERFLIVPEPVDSGVVIDTDHPPKKKIVVPVGAYFRIRGEFQDAARFAGTKISGVSAHIKRLGFDGKVENIICGSCGGRTFREEDDERWFEMEMKAPPRSDWYRIFITPTDSGLLRKEIPPWVFDLHVGIPPDPEDEPK